MKGVQGIEGTNPLKHFHDRLSTSVAGKQPFWFVFSALKGERKYEGKLYLK